MRLNGLDLNLLVALHAVLSERNISRAAQRLFITQPAMSNALARLRHHFGDELVMRSGRQLLLTPRAESLVEPVREILMRIESTVAAPPQFDPGQSTRLFTLLASDYALHVLLRPLLRRLAQRAPGLRFDLPSQAGGDNLQRLDHGEVDLLIVPEQYRSERHPSLRLFAESYVCVVWREGPLAQAPLDFEAYLAAGHVLTQFGDGRVPAFDSWLMERHGLQRRAEVTVASLTAPLEMVVGTARIATVHRRLAEAAATRLPLSLLAPPLAIPALTEYAQWNHVRSDDPALKWLLAELQACAAELDNLI